VKPEEKVKLLKDKIKSRYGIQGYMYQLKETKNNTILDENKSIYSQYIRGAGHTVIADYKAFNIKVSVDGKDKLIQVDPEEKCSTIRDQLFEKYQIAKTGYSITKAGANVADGNLILDYKIYNTTKLVVNFNSININVEMGKMDSDDDTQISKGLVQACEFKPNAGLDYTYIDHCAKLWLGATKWNKVPQTTLDYFKSHSSKITSIQVGNYGWIAQFVKKVRDSQYIEPASGLESARGQLQSKLT
jgi:hypothetical protein